MKNLLTKEMVDQMTDKEILSWVISEVIICHGIAPQSELNRRLVKIRMKYKL